MRFPFFSVTTLFFIWGFITCLNDLLIPKFKTHFSLTQFQANLVQSAFFGAYFLVSLAYFIVSATKGDPINKLGYKRALVGGLFICGLGSFMFYPAAQWHSYSLFLTGLFILGAGVTLIQIAANPYVSILGPESSAPARLNLSQGLNSLGYVIAPFIGGLLLFGSQVYASGSSSLEDLKAPYLGLAVVFILLGLTFAKLKLPKVSQESSVEKGVHAFSYPQFRWGWLAIFFYVGSEVTVGSILINYLADPSVMGLDERSSSHFLSFYWGGLMIGRLMGAASLSEMSRQKKTLSMLGAAIASTLIIFASATFKEKLTLGTHIAIAEIVPFFFMVAISFLFFWLGKTQSQKMVGTFAAVATLLTIIAMLSSGPLALWAIVGIGLFNSIMWSNIFTSSIKGLGKHTSQGSSLLVMMIVGGAIMPAIQGALMDSAGVRASLGIVVLGYLYLTFYGWFSKQEKASYVPA